MMEKKPSIQNWDRDQYRKALKTGTTTVAMKIKEGVLIGTESQATAGYTVATKQAQKLFKINKYTAATISGGVADCQYVINQLRALSNLKQVEDEEVPEPKHVANLCRNILFSGRSFFLSMMIVGGYSVSENSGKLYGIDLLGTLYEEDQYISFGSGSPFSLGVLESDWKEDMTQEKAVSLLKTAITSSKERDAASGYDIQICVINEEGYKKIQ